jgi:Flp pilus assembly pilin Flp
MPYLRRFVREESGQDRIEYRLLAAFISIVAIAALQTIDPLVRAIYRSGTERSAQAVGESTGGYVVEREYYECHLPFDMVRRSDHSSPRSGRGC